MNMPNLITHLKKVAEQKPQATYYNVDMLKYQVCGRGSSEMLELISGCPTEVCVLERRRFHVTGLSQFL